MTAQAKTGSGRWARFALGMPLALYIASAAAFLAHSAHVRDDFPLDDAWIHQVYARSLAHGQGFAYNEGRQETGATSPLWAVACAPAHWLAAAAGPETLPWGVKALGLVLGGVSVALVFGIVARALGSPWAGALAATIVATEPRFMFSALSGMETALLLVLWLGAVASGQRGRARLATALAGLMPLVRPEAAIVLVVAAAGWVVLARGRTLAWRDPWALPLLLGPGVAWALFCTSVSGHWLPNTYYLKAQPFALDLGRLATAWRQVAQFGWTGGIACAVGLAGFAWWLAARRDREAAWLGGLLALAPATYALGVVGSREIIANGYYWSRWLDPPALVLAVTCGAGLAALAVGAKELASGRIPQLALRTAVALALAVSLPGVGASWAERRERLATDGRAIRKMNVEPALWVAANVPPDAVVGVNDAGAFRLFGEHWTIDLNGLNNYDIAFHRISPREVLARLDWIAVFPSWFESSGLLRFFESARTFQMPVTEYTICDCPGQTTVVVGRKIRSP